MCQCNQNEAKAQTTAAIDNDGIIEGLGIPAQGTPVILNLHYGELGEQLKEAEVAPGEVVVDNEFRVSHNRPESLIELIQMAQQLNGCLSFGSDHANTLIAESANFHNLSNNAHRLYTQEQVEECLVDQREALAKIIVAAVGSFARTLSGRVDEEVLTEELNHAILDYTGDYIADAIGDRVEEAIDNTLANMGLGPR